MRQAPDAAPAPDNLKQADLQGEPSLRPEDLPQKVQPRRAPGETEQRHAEGQTPLRAGRHGPAQLHEPPAGVPGETLQDRDHPRRRAVDQVAEPVPGPADRAVEQDRLADQPEGRRDAGQHIPAADQRRGDGGRLQRGGGRAEGRPRRQGRAGAPAPPETVLRQEQAGLAGQAAQVLRGEAGDEARGQAGGAVGEEPERGALAADGAGAGLREGERWLRAGADGGRVRAGCGGRRGSGAHRGLDAAWWTVEVVQ